MILIYLILICIEMIILMQLRINFLIFIYLIILKKIKIKKLHFSLYIFCISLLKKFLHLINFLAFTIINFSSFKAHQVKVYFVIKIQRINFK